MVLLRNCELLPVSLPGKAMVWVDSLLTNAGGFDSLTSPYFPVRMLTPQSMQWCGCFSFLQSSFDRIKFEFTDPIVQDRFVVAQCFDIDVALVNFSKAPGGESNLID